MGHDAGDAGAVSDSHARLCLGRGGGGRVSSNMHQKLYGDEKGCRVGHRGVGNETQRCNVVQGAHRTHGALGQERGEVTGCDVR